MSTKIKLSNVRLSFPDLYTAKEFQAGDGRPRYNASFLITPGDANDKAVEAAIAAEVKAAFPDAAKGAKWLANVRGQKNGDCYTDGDRKDYDGYAGCYVNGTVEIYLQAKGENQGIRCGLQAVQFARDGDAFSGSKMATPDDFDAIAEGADADPMA